MTCTKSNLSAHLRYEKKKKSAGASPEKQKRSRLGGMESVKEILTKMGAPTKDDLALVEKAYDFAAEAHKEHKRFSGEPYLVHLVETAKGLAGLGMGAKT